VRSDGNNGSGDDKSRHDEKNRREMNRVVGGDGLLPIGVCFLVCRFLLSTSRLYATLACSERIQSIFSIGICSFFLAFPAVGFRFFVA